jgi:hypothetical protein
MGAEWITKHRTPKNLGTTWSLVISVNPGEEFEFAERMLRSVFKPQAEALGWKVLQTREPDVTVWSVDADKVQFVDVFTFHKTGTGLFQGWTREEELTNMKELSKLFHKYFIGRIPKRVMTWQEQI